MGAPAIVQGDQIQGICTIHTSPPFSQSAGPLPFAAPLTQDLSTSVLIKNKPAAVVGSKGLNTPPHAQINDPLFKPPIAQLGRIMTGSATVFFDGKPAATAQSSFTCCSPTDSGKVAPTVTDVLIG